MKITIHCGSHEIGGTCIEVSTENSRILLDAGLPLAPDSGIIDLNTINPDAVIISHPHQDHYGLISKLPDTVPVYIGKLAKELLDATRIFLEKSLHSNNFQHYDKNHSFTVGDFKLTPYLVDHSAVDAYGFLIEADGKKIFYSGDFRGHGKKGKLFQAILHKPPTGIDALFMEGTMMERNNDAFPDEGTVQQRIQEIIAQQQNISFLISSSQNIDRLVSAYNACAHTGKIIVIDFYSAWVLEKVKSVSPGIRAMDWQHIAVLKDGRASGHQYAIMSKDRSQFAKFINTVFKHTVSNQMLHENPDKFLVLGKIGYSTTKLIESFASATPVNIIYSQWLGYLKPANSGNRYVDAMSSFQRGEVPGVVFTYTHTSGHATVQDLQRFATAIKPKILVPIHTEYAHLYREFFDNVIQFEDGKTYEI
jgi:ribonuclease J